MENNQMLAILEPAVRMLAEARTIQETKNVLDVAVTAKAYARQKKLGAEAVLYATAIEVEALKQLGNMLKETPKNEGGRPVELTGTKVLPVIIPTLADIGLDKKTSKLAQDVASLPDEQIAQVKKGDITVNQAITEKKRQNVISKLENIEAQEVKELAGVYDVIVIDPPWDTQKIERDVRPNQSEFDYPTMTDDEIKNMVLPMADDCHVWLWTTHKKLPFAFELLQVWNLKYVCTFTWHKNGGFQVTGLPQYNSEFCLYARKGTPIFVDTKDFMTCFDAPRKAHSEKPQEFYNVVNRVTTGRRLDIFNRRPIEGFDTWGNEAK